MTTDASPHDLEQYGRSQFMEFGGLSGDGSRSISENSRLPTCPFSDTSVVLHTLNHRGVSLHSIPSLIMPTLYRGEIVRSQGLPSGPQVAIKDKVLHTFQSVGQKFLGASPLPAKCGDLASVLEPLSTLGMAIDRGWPLITDLELSVWETLHSAGAPSTRMMHGNCCAAFP